MARANRKKEDIRHLFGSALRRRRLRMNLSQEELAARVGIHRTYLADIERGARNVSLVNLEKIATGLGISLAALLDGLGEE